jgi:hypothetical protein
VIEPRRDQTNIDAADFGAVRYVHLRSLRRIHCFRWNVAA